MTQEEKQLLLKDLCGRLPYKVKVEAVPYADPQILCSIDPIREEFRLDFGEYRNIFAINWDWVGEEYSIVKPYLRPMSSMTEEEKELMKGSVICFNELEGNSTLFDEIGLDWLNAHHFDYRGLIPMGLALEAPEDMYKNRINYTNKSKI